MKKFILIFLCFIPIFTLAQSSCELSLYGKGFEGQDNTVVYSAGAMFEWLPTSKQHLGLNYSLRFGNNENNHFVFQCPIGAFTGLLALAYFEDDILSAGLGALLCFIPEGLSYNIGNSSGFTVAPYCNPALLEFSSDGVSPIIELGAKVKFPLWKRCFVAVDLSAQSKYDYKNIRPTVGVNFGWHW